MPRVIDGIIISSKDAKSISADGSSMEFNLGYTKVLPLGTYARLVKMTCYFDMPNIITGNDFITFSYDNVIRILLLPQGNYGISDINERISELLINSGMSGDLFGLVLDQATDLLSFTVLHGAVQFSMDFSAGNPVFNLLGFKSGTYNVLSGQSVESTVPPALNVVNAIIPHFSNAKGYTIGTRGGSNAIAMVNIPRIGAGEQITYEPYNPGEFDLISNLMDGFTFRLTTESGTTPYITNNPITAEIHFMVP